MPDSRYEPKPMAYAGNPLDRTGHWRHDEALVAARLADPGTRFLPVWRLQPLVAGDTVKHPGWVRRHELGALADEMQTVSLGLDRETAHFAIDVSALEEQEARGRFVDFGTFVELRSVHSEVPAGETAILATARSMTDWHRRHGFCANCGRLSVSRQAGFVRVCTNEACSQHHFPRTDPVVIMLIANGDRCLLGRQDRFPAGWYSTLAGFVEPGETIEEAVRREVKEENVRRRRRSSLRAQPALAVPVLAHDRLLRRGAQRGDRRRRPRARGREVVRPCDGAGRTARRRGGRPSRPARLRRRSPPDCPLGRVLNGRGRLPAPQGTAGRPETPGAVGAILHAATTTTRGETMRRAGFAASGIILALGVTAAWADAPASGAPRAVSLMHYIHATQNVDTTLAFYREVFGLEAPPPAPFQNPGAALLNNVPGLTLRLSRPILPGEKYGLEFTEFGHVDRKGGQALPTDPGAVELILRVRDLDAVYAAVKKRGAPILSRNGRPVKIQTSSGPARALLVRDPDGYLVRAVEAPAAASAVAGNIQGGTSLALAVEDLDATMKFYNGVLGFSLAGETPFRSDPAMAELFGAPAGSEFRHATATFPGEHDATMEFIEWKGVQRKPFHLRVPDPGAGGMVMGVTHLDAIVAKVKAQGLPTVTPEPIWFTPSIRDIFVQDPNGLNLELYESVPKKQTK